MNKKFKISKSVIPNSFTSFNAMAGFASIIASKEGHYEYAVYLILLAAIFDALDGIMARLTKSSSQFGVELDSLVDCVSFGAAPAFLIYNADLFRFGIPGIILSSCLLIFGAFRLARFNVELVGFDKNYFTGLPIPFSAITLASYIYAFANPQGLISPDFSKYSIFLVVALSLIMVSKIKYPVLPKPNMESLKRNTVMIIFAIISIIFLLLTSVKNTFYILAIFIIFGAVKHFYNYIKNYERIKKIEIKNGDKI